MKRFLTAIKHLFVGHNITQHKLFPWGGAYYCPGCDRYYEYCRDEILGFSEYQISKEMFERIGAKNDNN